MSPTTPLLNLPYPQLADTPDVPFHMQQLAEDVEAALKAGAWAAYVPVWTASTTAPALGNGSLTGAYRKIGRTVQWRMRLALGSTSTVGSGTYFFTPPATPVNPGNYVIGHGMLVDAGGSNYLAVAYYIAEAGGFRVYASQPAVAMTHTAPFAPGNGDVLTLSGVYESAA